MPQRFIRVRDTRTDQILLHTVPESFLTQYPHLKEVPSSKARTALVQEPVVPAIKDGVAPKKPAKPEQKKEA